MHLQHAYIYYGLSILIHNSIFSTESLLSLTKVFSQLSAKVGTLWSLAPDGTLHHNTLFIFQVSSITLPTLISHCNAVKPPFGGMYSSKSKISVSSNKS